MDREIFIFPVQLTTCRTGNLTRLILTLAMCVTIRTRNSTTENNKRKDMSCYMLETIQLIPLKKKDDSCYEPEELFFVFTS